METRHPARFAHRPLKDQNGDFIGTIDSICLKCYLTIATTTNAADKQAQESAHTCAGFDLAHMFRGYPETVATIGIKQRI